MQLARPADDELFGVGIEIALAERRRVHRVEQLIELADVHLDDLASGQQGVTMHAFGDGFHMTVN